MSSLLYKDQLTAAMTALAADPLTRFVGYGMQRGGALGTLREVPPAQIVEMPVAENLLLGAAMGMALRGLRPLVYIERMDFLLNALDCLVNHLDKIAELSRPTLRSPATRDEGGPPEFSPGVIVRVTVGNREKPLFTGAPHIQDYTFPLRWMLKHTAVVHLNDDDDILGIYAASAAQQREGKSSVIVEYKDLM